jgi:cytochrome c peroxidase
VSRRLRVALAAAIAAAGALALVLLVGGGSGAASPADPHAEVGRLPEERVARILDAAETSSTQRSEAELVAEGRRLFRSSSNAKSGESCQACHTDGGGANAELGIILHEDDFRGPRDVASLWGVGRTPPYGWNGRTDDLEEFVVGTIVSHFKGGDSQPEADTAAQAAAIAAYLRTLEPPVTPFDQGTLSEAALRGEALFQGKGGCAACHGGPLLTDNALHDTRVPKVTPSDTDTGAATSGPLRGAFNTPQMRDLRNTAPYMHNGSIKTLRDVVRFYNERSSVAPLSLTPAEVDDIAAYLAEL